MQAARLHRVRTPDAPEVVSIDEVPAPEAGPGEVVVRIAACGVCASDLHVVDGTTPGGELPLILGHEAAGTVAEVGDGVDRWVPGDRVAVGMARTCGRCRFCTAGRESLCAHLEIPGIDRDGSHAELTVVREDELLPVPDAIPLEQAAIMTDAVATPFHALRRADMEAGTTCAVFGLGGLGMHAIRLARALGAGWIVGVDLDERNLERALAWGADEVVSAADGKPARAIRKRSDGGVDRAFEFVGNPDSQSQAVKSLRPGGRAVVVGLTPRELSTLPAALFVAQELEVVGAFGSSRSDVEDLFGMVADGRLDLSKSITHRWSLPELPDALRALEMREGHPIRMIVSYG